jgi:hypothetical protein
MAAAPLLTAAVEGRRSTVANPPERETTSASRHASGVRLTLRQRDAIGSYPPDGGERGDPLKTLHHAVDTIVAFPNHPRGRP